MVNTLKVTQAEKQIYPQSCGKVKKASPAKRRNDHTSPGGGTGSVTGTNVPMRRGDHQNDRREDDRSGNDGA